MTRSSKGNSPLKSISLSWLSFANIISHSTQISDINPWDQVDFVTAYLSR